MTEVIIIGGGVTGLVTAYHLRHRFGRKVLILERTAQPGGKAQTRIEDGFATEIGTNGWLDKEPAMRTLLDELRISTRVQPSDETASRRFIYRKGRLRELQMHPLKFMTSNALPLGARLRIAMEPFVKQRRSDDDETLADFATRRLGVRAKDFLIGPMASGVYAGDPDQMSLKSCFKKVYDLEQHHGGLIKGMVALKKAKKARGEDPAAVQAGPSGKLTSFKGGMQELIDALVKKLEGCIRLNTEVESVTRNQGTFRVTVKNSDPLLGNAVLSAAPAWAAARYLNTLDAEAARAFAQIPYPGLDVVCLGFPISQIFRPPVGFGFLVPRGQGITLLGTLFTSSIFPGRAPDGLLLLRNMIGGMLAPEVAGWDEAEVVAAIRRDLEKCLGIDRNLPSSFQKVFRHEKAIPQYHVGHSALLHTIRGAESRYPGFFASGNALKGIGVIDCVREALPTATAISSYLDAVTGESCPVISQA